MRLRKEHRESRGGQIWLHGSECKSEATYRARMGETSHSVTGKHRTLDGSINNINSLSAAPQTGYY